MNWPFATFIKYPAAPNPDKTNSKVHDQDLPLYNPYAVNNEVNPKIIKKAGPIK